MKRLLLAAMMMMFSPLVAVAQQQPLLLRADDGEWRARLPRPGLGLASSFILKVDQRNGGSPDLLFLSERLHPGDQIPWHRHLHQDEIVYIESGSIAVHVGNRIGTLRAHGTLYIPRHTWVTIRNANSEDVRLLAIFNQPAFGRYLRCTSVPEGQPTHRLSKSELAACRRLGDVEYR
jgi:hypothetical protein